MNSRTTTASLQIGKLAAIANYVGSCYPSGNRFGAFVEICFSDEHVRDLCCSRHNLVRRFGAEIGRKICCRLSMLSAAPSLAMVPTVPPVGLTAVDRKGLYHVAVGAAHVLVLRAFPLEAARAGDLTRITEIQIIGPTDATAAKGTKR